MQANEGMQHADSNELVSPNDERRPVDRESRNSTQKDLGQLPVGMGWLRAILSLYRKQFRRHVPHLGLFLASAFMYTFDLVQIKCTTLSLVASVDFGQIPIAITFHLHVGYF